MIGTFLQVYCRTKDHFVCHPDLWDRKTFTDLLLTERRPFKTYYRSFNAFSIIWRTFKAPSINEGLLQVFYRQRTFYRVPAGKNFLTEPLRLKHIYGSSINRTPPFYRSTTDKRHFTGLLQIEDH